MLFGDAAPVLVTATGTLLTRSDYPRQVSIDDHGRMIAIVYARVPERDYGDVAAIIRNTGAVYTKGPKGERTAMPAWCLLVQLHRRLKVFSGPFGSDDACGSCALCRELGEDKRAIDDDAPLWGCTLCAGFWHATCAASSGASADDLSHPYVCPLCEI